MKYLSRLLLVVLVSLGLALPAAADDTSPDPVPVDYLIPELPPAPVAGPCGFVSCADLIRYMRALPPDVLIDVAFAGTGAAPRMKAIALRESGLGRGGRPAVSFDPACSAANPSSSARGLFQTLRSVWAGPRGWWPGVAHYGFTWAEIEGPDCLADVVIARKIWDGSGFGPWT